MSQERKEQSYLTTVSLVVIAFVSLAISLVYTRTVMIPFVLALFIVSLVSPVQDFQVKRLRFPRFVAALVTLLLVLVVMGMVSLLVYSTMQTVVLAAREYSSNLAKVANLALAPLEYIYRQEESPPAVTDSTDANAARSDLGEPDGREPVEPPTEVVLVPGTPNEPSRDRWPLLTFPVPPPEPKPRMEEEPNEPALNDPNAAADPNAAVDPNAVIDPNGVKDPNRPVRRGKDTPATRVRRLDTKQLVSDVQEQILNLLTNAVGTVLGLISGTFFSIIFVMFIVMGRDPYAEHSEIYANIVGKVRRYIGTKVVISLVTGLLVWLVLDRLGLPLAGVFGILAFLLNFIPSIGSIFSTMLPIPVAVAQFQGPEGEIVWPLVLVAVALPGAVQITMGNVIEPKLMGGGLNLHPVTVLLALSFWGLLWGIPGMFLAAPITAAIRIVLMQFDTLRPFGQVLAGDFSSPVKAELAKPAPPPRATAPAPKQSRRSRASQRKQSK